MPTMKLPVAFALFGLCASAEAAPEPKAAVRAMTAGGPQIAYERFRASVQVEVAERREEQISGLLRLLELGPEPAEKPDLEFRLAELYADKARAKFLLGQGLEPKKEAERAKLLEESDQWSAKAIEVYARIRAEHPGYNRMPEVLFALGQSEWTRGAFEAAVRPYADLIREHPDSPLVAEAWTAIGEYYFNEGNIFKALRSYEEAAKNTRSRIYGFALYKQGWCFFNLAEWEKALNKFEATVLYSQMSEELSGENKIELGKEAERDWVRTYVHVGSPDRARFDIARLLDLDACTGRCLTLLDGLAGLWFGEGYFKESKEIYQQLIGFERESLKNPFRQARVVDIADRAGNKPQTIAASRDLVRIFLATKERFAALPESSAERIDAAGAIEEAEISSEATLRRLAQEWNREAAKTRRKETKAQSETMYADYLALFSDTDYGLQMRFERADLLFKLERFDDAATGYREVVERSPEGGKFIEEAATDHIRAIEEHLKDLGLRLPGNLSEPTEPHPEHRRLVAAADLYLEKVASPKEPSERAAVALTAARVLYAYNQYPEALARFDGIVTQHPETEQAEVAANLVADIHNLRKDWQSLYDAARRYLDAPRLMEGRPKLRAALEGFGQYAKFALVKQLEDGGEPAEVAKAYESFHREFPASDSADDALFNASILYDKAGDKERASMLRAKLLEDYPASGLRPEVAHYVAKQLEERTEYAEAARAYLAFAQEFPKDERARDALYDASVFYAATGEARTAARLRQRYLDTYGKTEAGASDAALLSFAIAQDLDRARRFREAADAYAAYAKRYAGTERGYDALWRQAEIRRENLRQGAAADKIEAALLAEVKGSMRRRRSVPPNAMRHASLAAFRQVDADFVAYRKLRLPVPNLRNPAPFQKALRTKAQARDKLVRAYTAIVSDYKQAEASIAALARIAESWDEFVAALGKIPCPRGSPAEVCEVLEQRLSEMSMPAQDSAVAAYKTCVVQSNALDTFTEASARCAKRLEALAPEIAPPVVERMVSAPSGSMAPRLASQPLRLRRADPGPVASGQRAEVER